MPRRTNLHPADVQARVRKAGGSLIGIAREMGVDHSTVSHALRRPIPRVNRQIAAFLGKRLCDLWPEWFDADGHRSSTANGTQAPGRSQRQKARAA